MKVTTFGLGGYQPATQGGNIVAEVDLTAPTVVANAGALVAKARAALATNAAFLAIASPSNAQAVAQVQALTRQVNALIKLALDDLADISAT